LLNSHNEANLPPPPDPTKLPQNEDDPDTYSNQLKVRVDTGQNELDLYGSAAERPQQETTPIRSNNTIPKRPVYQEMCEYPYAAQQMCFPGDQSSVTEQLDLNRSSVHTNRHELGNDSHPYIESRNVYGPTGGGWNPKSQDYLKHQAGRTHNDNVYVNLIGPS